MERAHRMTGDFPRLAGALLAAYVGICPVWGALAAGPAGNPIPDIRYWVFDEIENDYVGGGETYIKVMKGGRTFFWNFDKMKMEVFSEAAQKSLRITNLGHSPELSETKVTADVSMWMAYHYDCTAADYQDPLRLTWSSIVRSDSFYVIAKRSQPQDVHRCLPGAPDGVNELYWERMKRDYGEPFYGELLAAANGTILTDFWPANPALIIGLRSPPDKILSFETKIYFIPATEVSKQLEKAGASLHARYQVFLDAIARATPVVPSDPGPVYQHPE